MIAPGVHHFDTFPFNWYVVEEAGRLTLVDAGFPDHYDVLIAGLRSIGRELRDVEAVVLTHIHADHVGFAERLRRELGVPVYVHEDDLAASSTCGGRSSCAASSAARSAPARPARRASSARSRTGTETCSTYPADPARSTFPATPPASACSTWRIGRCS